MLFRVKTLFCQHRIHVKMSQKHIALFLLLICLCINRAESVEDELGSRNCKAVFSCTDLNRCRFISRRFHTAGRKTLPDQLIQPELIPCKRILQGSRCPADISRTDRFMCVLDLLVAISALLPGCCIFFSICRGNIFPRRCVCLISDSGRIRTQIGDHTDCSVPLNINSFIQLLRNAHRLLCSKIQSFCSLLLKSTCGKRERRFADTLALLYISNLKLSVLNLRQYLAKLLFRMDCYPVFICSIKLCRERTFFSFHLQNCIQSPVFFRNKRVDLIFSVSHKTQRYRLHSSRAQSSFDLCPEKRTDPVAHHTVKDTSRLLCIYQIHINVSRSL